MEQVNSKGWCILRTGDASTLPLAKAISDEGYEAWAPAEVRAVRAGLRRVRVQRPFPIVPGIVFANAESLAALVALSRMPAQNYRRFNPETRAMEIQGRPPFSVFRFHGRFPMIADRALDPLRVAEHNRIPAQAAPRFAPGEHVKITEGGFAGLAGVVADATAKFTVVCFPGFSVPITISNLLLVPDRLEEQTVSAAQAA